MSEFTLITASDIHISDVNPRSRKDNFKESILNKLDQMKDACNKLKADAAIIAGDLFNLKNPTKNSHGLTRELIEIFKEFKCQVFMIPGNHDLTGNSLESLSTQPLGVLFASGAVTNLEHAILYKNKGGTHIGRHDILLQKNTAKISLVGIPYTEDKDLLSVKLPDNTDNSFLAQVCVMHVYAGPRGGMLFKERLYGYDELSDLNANIFVIGHYHLDQGIQKIKDKFFINLGSVSRGTLTDENIDHQPKLGLIRIEYDNTPTLTSITADSLPLNCKPANEIFDLKKRDEEIKEAADMQKFVDTLASSITVLESQKDTKNYEEIINKMDIVSAVRERVLHFLHEAIK